jgi:hypothetical protein
MVIVPHPLYSPDLAPCDFSLSPELQMKSKRRRFETVSDIQRESQAALDSIKENHSHVSNHGIAVYVPKETILKEMPAKMKLRQHFLFFT